jgi:Transmembrane secretion effector
MVAKRWREVPTCWLQGSLFRRRDFRLLWVGETTSEFGSAVTWVALPLIAVQSLHVGPFEVALLTAATWLPWLVIGFVAGAWVDRLPRRPVMLVCDVVSMLLLASVPVADWCGVLTIGRLLAVALLAGVCTVFFTSADQAYLPTLAEGEDLVEVNAKLQGGRSAAQIGGPGLAGGIAALAGVASGLLADAVSFAVSALCLCAIGSREPELQAPTERRDLRREVLDGLRFLFTDPYIRCRRCLDGLGWCGWGVRRPVRAASHGPARHSPRGAVLLHRGAGNVVYDGFVQRYTPPEMVGRIGASVSTVAYCCMPVGAVLAGGLGSLAGVRVALWVMAAGLVATGGLLLWSPYRHLRDLPAVYGDSAEREQRLKPASSAPLPE